VNGEWTVGLENTESQRIHRATERFVWKRFHFFRKTHKVHQGFTKNTEEFTQRRRGRKGSRRFFLSIFAAFI